MKPGANSPERWLTWQGPAINEKSANSEPTKPSKPGSVGFEASGSAPTCIIELLVAGANDDPRLDSRPPVERPMSWAEWKAMELNRLFLEHGATGQPGRITAATVLNAIQMEHQTKKSGAGR